GALPVTDLLAVVEHRGLVLLALADDDDTVHAHARDHRAHRVHGGPVGAVLVAPAHPAAAGERGGLGDPDQLHRQVPVWVHDPAAGRLGLAHCFSSGIACHRARAYP